MKARPLTEILSSQAEGLEWRADLPKLTEAVPGDQFADLVSQGVLFEDWVELQHGVQSHRLQWYLIQKQFPGIALALYKEMVHPDWDQKGGRKMWDLVVDSTASANAFDFTHPATLERYLKDNYRAPIFWRNRLATAIQAGEDQYPETKDMLGDKARLLAQDEEPAGPVQTEDGRWTGWKKFAGQWRPTIYYPN